ncbi:hypothetical protein KPATCC21470_2861 [Kitasatospora purpeofusca]
MASAAGWDFRSGRLPTGWWNADGRPGGRPSCASRNALTVGHPKARPTTRIGCAACSRDRA